MDIISILRILKRKIWALIIFPLISVGCSIYFISRMDREYKSIAQIATGFTSDEAVTLNDEKTSNPFEVTTKFTNTVESMKSIPVLSLVSYKLTLHDLAADSSFRKPKVSTNDEFVLDEETVLKAEQVIQARLDSFQVLNSYDKDDRLALFVIAAYSYDIKSLSKNFVIYRRSTSDFITVEFISENPFISAFSVNALCEEFIRYNKVLKTDRSSESIDFLYSQMEEKKKLRDEKTQELSAFKVNNKIFNYGAESENKIKQISDYQFEKGIEEKRLAGLMLSLKMVKEKISNFKGIDNAEVARINQRIIELRRRINEIDGTKDSNRIELEQLREELQLETSRLESVSQGENPEILYQLKIEKEKYELEIQISNSNLAAINNALERLRYDASGFASTEAKLGSLEREVERASEEYKEAQEKYSAASSKASVIGSSLRQVLQGQPSDKPEPSKALLYIGLSGLGTFIFCLLVILGTEMADFSIRNQIRLESYTGLKNITIINQVDIQPSELDRIFDRRKLDPKMESFVNFIRKLRFDIQGTRNQVILITSTKADVGKSFITIALSYSLSLLNKTVLIVDTNFKNRTLTNLLIPKTQDGKYLVRGINELHLLNAENKSGEDDSYIKSMKDDKSKGANERNIIHKTKILGVDIIGNHGGKESPHEILAGKQFDVMINNLVLQYDYILMEGPALNDYADTRELIEYVDKVIVVFDAQSVLSNLDFDSLKFLKSLKSKLLGTVLNKVRQENVII